MSEQILYPIFDEEDKLKYIVLLEEDAKRLCQGTYYYIEVIANRRLN